MKIIPVYCRNVKDVDDFMSGERASEVLVNGGCMIVPENRIVPKKRRKEESMFLKLSRDKN